MRSLILMILFLSFVLLVVFNFVFFSEDKRLKKNFKYVSIFPNIGMIFGLLVVKNYRRLGEKVLICLGDKKEIEKNFKKFEPVVYCNDDLLLKQVCIDYKNALKNGVNSGSFSLSKRNSYTILFFSDSGVYFEDFFFDNERMLFCTRYFCSKELYEDFSEFLGDLNEKVF